MIRYRLIAVLLVISTVAYASKWYMPTQEIGAFVVFVVGTILIFLSDVMDEPNLSYFFAFITGLLFLLFLRNIPISAGFEKFFCGLITGVIGLFIRVCYGIVLSIPSSK